MITQEGMARYLTACKHDVAHLPGAPKDDVAAWVAANQDAALALFLEIRNAQIAEGSDGIEAAEQALVAVKKWAQGTLFRG